jgi:adenine-specific DNA-methyltransferase
MLATNKVANTTGTYGYFLSELSESARKPIKLQPTQFSAENGDNTVYHGRARDVLSSNPSDVTYLDPPYNKRQYAAYYHILETIAHEDEPELIGKSGLRPWQEKFSDFCYKARAPDALRRVLKSTNADYAFVSYSEDGHIPHERMRELLSEFGKAEHLELAHTRYSSHESTDSSPVTERLYRVKLT